jgi:diguanylate cyclase (GGDEF)-like protein
MLKEMRPIHRLRGRGAPLFSLVVGIILVLASLGFGYAQHVKARTALEEHLRNVAREETAALANYFERARSIVLLTAQNPAFRNFYRAPGSREVKVQEGGPAVLETQEALDYLHRLYPTSIGESCFIDVAGPENSRVVRGVYATPEELSPDESSASFFGPTFDLPAGRVYQAEPYVSPDTGEWVISNSTPVPELGNEARAIVHYEVTVESFRRQAAALSEDAIVHVLDSQTGKIIINTELAQRRGAGLGEGGSSPYAKVLGSGSGTGTTEIEGSPAVFRWLPVTAGNANRWVVVASPKARPGPLATLGFAPIGMLLTSVVLLVVGVVWFQNSQKELTAAALTDGLTGLGNRRKLMADLGSATAAAKQGRPFLLAIFDLDGFKTYNDTFGHPAGDALLVRLAHKFQAMVRGRGNAYRMGGDEFCLLTQESGGVAKALAEAAALALSERGEGFHVTCSKGWCLIPSEAADSSPALHLADTRMYADKFSRKPTPERQSRDVLLRALHERYPELHDHLEAVGNLAERVGRRMELTAEEVAWTRRAGELHDVGKVAIPDAILRKPGRLDEDEWLFMQRHTVVGERILEVAPSLSSVARLVRSHHERVDGGGYPDGLLGEQIPLGARIVAVCDAYHAMTAGRVYKAAISHAEAVAELRRNAGKQFDSSVVEAFCDIVVEEDGRTHDLLVHGHS